MKEGNLIKAAVLLAALLGAGPALAECKGAPGPGDGPPFTPIAPTGGRAIDDPGAFGVRDLFGCPFSISPNQEPGAELICQLDESSVLHCLAAPVEEGGTGHLLYFWAYSQDGELGDHEESYEPEYTVKCAGGRTGVYLTVTNGTGGSHASAEYRCR